MTLPARRILVATDRGIVAAEAAGGPARAVRGPSGRHPTCLASDAGAPERAWCGTREDGVWRSDDGGAGWVPAGLEGEHVTAVATAPGRVWAGTEPSTLWRSDDGGATWTRLRAMERLPSSSEWSFPPKPETHHVRWIACHPHDPNRVWVAIEAGALVSTKDGGDTWMDRVPGGPYDTHELAVSPAQPDTLRVSAGDGYYESHDGGATWASPSEGLEVGYLRSVAVDPGDADTVVVSAASRPRSAYVAGHADGRLYRREGDGPWTRVRAGWPDPPETIAPLLAAGSAAGELWAADERGVHRSTDAGVSWSAVASFPATPGHLRGLVILSRD